MISTLASAEALVVATVYLVKFVVETFAAGLVVLGVCLAVIHLTRAFTAHRRAEFTETRLILARYLLMRKPCQPPPS